MTNDTWLIRAKAKTGLKTKERERQVIGTLHEAARAHLELKEELFAELRAAEGAANDVDKTAPRELAAPTRAKSDEPARVAMAPSEPARAPTKASERSEPTPAPTKASDAGAFVADWLHLKRKKNGVKQAGIDNQLYRVERFFLRWLDKRPRLSITTLDDTDIVDDWEPWLTEQTQPEAMGKGKNARAGQQYSRAYLHSTWSTVKNLMAFVSRRSKTRNPFEGLRFNLHTKTPPRQKDAATQEEIKAIVKEARHESRDIRLMIVMEVALGVRFAEVSALEWGDIDLDRGFLLIQRSQNEGEVGETKTVGTRRPKALLPEVIELLREHRAWQIENEVPGLERHLVFPSRKGGYRTPSILTKPLARCIERAGLSKRLTSHALRRTTNTLVVETAGDATARKMLGHAPTAFQMTERYLVVDRERELSVMRKALGDALGGAKESEESGSENDSGSPTLRPHQNGRFTTPQ
jgi:integrase